MTHTIKNTRGKYITQDDNRQKILHMVAEGYTSTIIDNKKVTIISSGIVNVKNKAQVLTVVSVDA